MVLFRQSSSLICDFLLAGSRVSTVVVIVLGLVVPLPAWTGDYDLVILNFANPDMVGHTGFLDKAITAVETVDDCVRQVVEATVCAGGVALVTADHGNSDQMLDYDTGKPHTAHTTNLVPLIYVARQKPAWRLANGVLGNVAPTVLELLGQKQPPEMTCQSLIRS